MALVLADRVLETTPVAGTGDANLSGAVIGYQPFSTIGGGNTTYYTIVAIDDQGAPTGDWEVGIGTYVTAGNKLTRDTVLSSSNGGAKVYFASGTKQIFLDLPSEEVTNGNVVGPAFAVANNFASFNMTTGKLIKDSGYNASSFATAAQGAKADTAVQPGSLGSAAYLTAGAANGVATLDSSAKVPISQLPAAVLGALSYQGTWNASTNTPTLVSSAGTKGYYYVVSVAGTTNLNGITDWQIGDWAVYDGSVWEKVDNTDLVTSVNGKTGAVVLTYSDVGAQPAGTYVTSVSATSPVTSTGGTTPTIAMPAATTSVSGYLTSTDWNTFNGKGSGSVTSVSGTGTVSGISLSGTVTTTGSLTLGGTLDLSSPPVIGGTTPNTITGTTINANTKFVAPDYYAQSILGGNLRTSGGTSLLNWDGGGSGNVTVNGGLLANSANKNVSLAPTGSGTVTINPATVGTFNNMVIGGTTPLAGTFTSLTATGTTTLATSLTGLAKLTSGVVSTATSGTDYAPATSGTSILYGNGAGGFSNVTIGSGVSFAGGTLSATGSGGTVTSVTGTAPVVSSGGTTPAISMAAATSSVNGYLTSTDWTTFNNKQATLVSGTNIKTVNSTSLLGSGDVSVGVTSVTGTAPVVSSGGATPAISMAAATTSVSGYLTSTDWTTFNNKVSSQWTTTGSTIYYSGGSVGVNTSTVAANCKLAVNGNPPTAGAISSVASSTGGYSLALSDNSSSSLYVSHPAGALSRFSTDGSGQISFATNGTTEAMRIDASQNVGIGTSSPAVKLDVASATPATVVRFSAGNTTLQSYIDNSVGGSYLAAGQVSGTSPTYMAFQTQPSGGSLTERMRITSSGGISFGSSGTAYGTSGQLLQSNGNAAPSWVTISAPQVTVYTSGSGTYTVPSGAKYITVEMIGGGGGGGGGGTPGTGGNGSQGGTTTFGSSSCTGGVGSATGTTGGSATLGSGFVGIAMTGNLGAGFTAWGAVAPVSIYGAGGTGGAGHWGGCGTGNANAAGSSAVANSGAGGGGGGTNNTSAVLIYGGAGSGAGGYIKATVTSLASSYSYSVGAGGTGGTAGTYGYAGGNGGSGIIIVTAYF